MSYLRNARRWEDREHSIHRGRLSTHLCKLVRANLTSLGTLQPLSTSRCDALYVGYDDGGEYVVA